ncbi:MAG TPA: DUF2218 domain-containing protein [Sphingomicrobium sp.]|jgi:hypothetical protein|nr:DUF2218 domain-containing protein [Sphingomicrobium sp.]
MLEAEARIATIEASRILTEVALAWVHTYPVRYDAITAEIELPGGELVMTADGDSLTLRLVGQEGEEFEAAKRAIADHVDRAAGRDSGVRCVWTLLS